MCSNNMYAHTPSSWLEAPNSNEAPNSKKLNKFQRCESVPSYVRSSTKIRNGMILGLPSVSEATSLRREAGAVTDTSSSVKVSHRRHPSFAESSRNKSQSNSLVEFDRRLSAPSVIREQIQRSLSPQARSPGSLTLARPKSASQMYAAPGSTRQLAVFCEEEKARFLHSRTYAASAKHISSKPKTLAPQRWLALSMWLTALLSVLSGLWAALTLFSFKRTRKLYTTNRAIEEEVLSERWQRMDELAASIDEKIRGSELTASRTDIDFCCRSYRSKY